jgi:hypothetical protein
MTSQIDDQIKNLSVEGHARNEEIRMGRNAWRVAEEIAERIDGAPVLGEFIDAQADACVGKLSFFHQSLCGRISTCNS